MISIRIRKPFLSGISRKQLLKTIEFLINEFVPKQNVDLGILICSDKEIEKLNRLYRNIAKATDVLSFGSDEIDPETGNGYLGDIIISFETASRQAVVAGHLVQIEISVLLIHGFLHLLGFDHDTKRNKDKMWNKQFAIHKLLGIDVDSLSGDDDQP